MIALLVITIATMIGAAGALFLKKGAGQKSIVNIQLCIGLCLYGLSTVLYLLALRMDELSILYPMTSLTYVWTAMLSMFVLKERMGRKRWTGILMIISGVYVIALLG